LIGEIKMLNKIKKFFAPETEQDKIQALLKDFSDRGIKPSIYRITTKWQGFGVENTKLFTKVRNGHTAEYYGNPFWNLYRITSKVGTLDHVTHSVRK